MVKFELPTHLEDADIDEISERADELYDELKRHLDPRGVIVGLSPKGTKAKRDTSGFVVR